KLPTSPAPLPLRRFQLGVSFRSSLYSRFLIGRTTRKSFLFPKRGEGHLVERYSRFVNRITGGEGVHRPTLPFPPTPYPKPAVGINPGAAYGPAKRWPPEKFAEVANQLGEEFQVVLFGGPGEEWIVQKIEERLKVPAVNLCGKLTLPELASQIAGLSLFITNDSGPMHIGVAYNVPLVAIFGPTDWRETSPYSPVAQIARIPVECAPCKRRECPFGHHRCMVELSPARVVELAHLAIKLKREIG
ncbi:MAG: lipopolysaccharide heptosyltransferase II, partial [Campylobacterales bacterium]